MRITRITLVIISLIFLGGFNYLVRKQLADVEPQLFQATEEAMVDTANLLASMVESDFGEGRVDTEGFGKAMEAMRRRDPGADIYRHRKSRVGLDFYITDRAGIVLFDSTLPGRVGQDYSRKRDVFLTLKGKYGARSSRDEERDDTSSVLHVAAPIGPKENPMGVLTVRKPQADVLPIVRRRTAEIWWGSGLIGGGIFLCVLVVFVWLYRPLSRLTEYAQDIEKGKRVPLPYLGIGKEVNTLARALESMREALEGRKFAERYVQTMTHEMKSPLAGIRGAAELLDEDGDAMPSGDRKRFLGNIRAESSRADRLLSKLHELSSLEGKSELDALESVDLAEVAGRAVEQVHPMADMAGVKVELLTIGDGMMVRGDPFILRAAVTNLLENAIDYSPPGGVVEVGMERLADRHRISISDRGPGIPDYAREKVFDRFFSLKHQRTGRKGTGLGLTLVREAVELHLGAVTLVGRDGGGTVAEMEIPSC